VQFKGGFEAPGEAECTQKDKPVIHVAGSIRIGNDSHRTSKEQGTFDFILLARVCV